jgi:hypothetical protein
MNTYLANPTLENEAILKPAVTKSPYETVAHSNRKPKSKEFVQTCPDCKKVLDRNESMHSCLHDQSDPVPPPGPLDSFFLSFSDYQYDPSIPLSESYHSFRQGLRQWSDWDGYSPSTWKEYKKEVNERYQAALTREFNLWFGTEDNIMSWHSLCRAIGIYPPPATPKLCRAVSNRFSKITFLF